MLESVLVWCGTICYGTSAALSLWALSWTNTKRNWLMYVFFVAGVTVLAAALAFRWIQLGQGPFMTLYEVLLSNAFSLGLIYALLFYLIPLSRHGSIVVIPFLFMMMMWALNIPAEPVPLPATFDNYWLWLHVFSGKIFLGFCLVAVGMSVILLLNQIRIKTHPFVFEAQVINMDALIWRFMAVAFIADSIMLVVGSVWAYDAWGRYWAWDPLETWALLTWLALGISLHIRLTFSVPAWSGWLMVMSVFVLAFLTFFGIPFISLAPHKGIF